MRYFLEVFVFYELNMKLTVGMLYNDEYMLICDIDCSHTSLVRLVLFLVWLKIA